MPASRAFQKQAAPGHDSEQQALLCTEVEAELMGLKAAYEQYFLGMERQPPAKRHAALKKQVNSLKTAFVRQTALKFRIASLAQKVVTYERLWERTLQEIEAGTYKRDLFKIKLKHGDQAKKKKSDLPGASNFDIDEDLDLSDMDSGDDLESAVAAASAAVDQRMSLGAPPPPPITGVHAAMPAVPAMKPVSSPAVPSIPKIDAARPQPIPGMPMVPPVAAARPPTGPIPGVKPVTGPVAAVKNPSGPLPAMPSVKPGTGPQPPATRPVAVAGKPTAQSAVAANSASSLSDQKIKAIYDAYVSAKKRCGEDTSSLSLGGVAETLKKQVPELMKTHNAKSVEFKVVIKEGKAVLRAMPKE